MKTQAAPGNEQHPATHSVPNLQFDTQVVDGDSLRTKLHADGEVVDGVKPPVCELSQQA